MNWEGFQASRAWMSRVMSQRQYGVWKLLFSGFKGWVTGAGVISSILNF